MSRAWGVIGLGLALAVGAFAAAYYLGPGGQGRSEPAGAAPELGWLRTEFHLAEGEYERIAQLHAEYQPVCAANCRRLAELRDRLRADLATTNQLSAEAAALLAERGRLQAECESNMWRHFYAVSRTMPPAEGRRYLEWLRDRAYPGAGAGGGAFYCPMHAQVSATHPGRCPDCGMDLLPRR